MFVRLRDQVIQEAMRGILEKIYEPILSLGLGQVLVFILLSNQSRMVGDEYRGFYSLISGLQIMIVSGSG